MKFTITTTLNVPVGQLLKKKLLYLKEVEDSLADAVETSLLLGVDDFGLSRSIRGRITVGRVTARRKK